jgi:putative transposase
MRELEVLDAGHLKLSWEDRKAFFEEELGEQVRSEVKRPLEEALEAERTDWLGVGRYVRDEAGRRDYRNGYYRRDLGTRLGLLRRLRVPRTRRGCRSPLLRRYQRRQESVNGLVCEAFLRGVSTRQMGEVLETVLGESYSPQTVSRIACGLDRAGEAFHQQRLRDEYVCVFLDGVVLKVHDRDGQVRRRTWPMSSFTNPASCDRIVFGVISHLNRSWEKKPLKEFTQNA